MSNETEQLYVQAKHGAWVNLLLTWREDPVAAVRCARYIRSGSGWTFLHQAAFWGNEPACRELIRHGASPTRETAHGDTSADIARQRSHESLAVMLDQAAASGSSLWEAPDDVALLPSSCLWSEATPLVATHDLMVAYGGGRAVVREGQKYWTDTFGRILVGWHGTVSPPRGMDGEPMVR